MTERAGEAGLADSRRSSADAFAAFYQDRYAASCRLAYLLTSDRDAAEDLVQEAFIRLRPRFDGLATPGGYLRTIIVNQCRNWHRSRRRRADRESRVANLALPDDADEEARLVVGLIATLPFRQRAVLAMRYWLDLTDEQIATELRCRPGTVRSLNSRALAQLRRELR